MAKKQVSEAVVADGHLVKFTADVFPYCKNDVVRLSKDEEKRVSEVAAERDLGVVFEDYSAE